MKVVITGANSAVGKAILRCSADSEIGPIRFVAAVRSGRAAEEVRPFLKAEDSVVQISYEDPSSLSTAFGEASAVIHLAGVLIESPGRTYEQANVAPTRSVVEAAKKSAIKKLVLISATGANETSANRYYRTKGQAESLIVQSGLSYTILRAPMLLGPGTQAGGVLKRSASQKKAKLVSGGRNLQQPLYVDDLARAAIHATDLSVAKDRLLDIVGPVSLPEREIFEKASELSGRQIRIRSIPKALARCALTIRRFASGPGFSTDALDVITADTNLDPHGAASELSLRLTGIDEMIRNSLGGSQE